MRQLKATAGGELQVPGSGVLVRWLLDNDLVDEITLFTVPVVVGQRDSAASWRASEPFRSAVLNPLDRRA